MSYKTRRAARFRGKDQEQLPPPPDLRGAPTKPSPLLGQMLTALRLHAPDWLRHHRSEITRVFTHPDCDLADKD